MPNRLNPTKSMGNINFNCDRWYYLYGYLMQKHHLFFENAFILQEQYLIDVLKTSNVYTYTATKVN